MTDKNHDPSTGSGGSYEPEYPDKDAWMRPIPNDPNHNKILDTENHYCKVNFLSSVDNDHIIKKLSLSVSKATHLPPHSVFLMGLGAFASVSSRRWHVNYQHGGSLPIGMYVIAEMPSGSAKSRALKVFQSPFFQVEKEIKKAAKKEISPLLDIEKKSLSDDQKIELNRLTNIISSVLFTTNSTPEALELSLAHSRGFFSAVSSEQGLFNSMLGGSYGGDKVSNNDLLLNGFDGGYMSSRRVSRDSYDGDVIGGAIMFSQAGGIETVLTASNGTGLSERFLLLAEPHNLGTRDHTQKSIIPNILTDEYNAICNSFAKKTIEKPIQTDDLSTLAICDEGWILINEYRNSIEHELRDGGKYSHVALRGSAAKIDMQIMKISANLHVSESAGLKAVDIDIRHVKTAIKIADEMIRGNLALCQDKGIVGVKAEYQSILSLFKDKDNPRSNRNIVDAKRKTHPFMNMANKNTVIKDAIKEMVSDGLLKSFVDAEGKTMYLLAQ